MTKELFIIVLLLIGFQSFSQQERRIEEVFVTPEVPPEFPGGQTELYKFLSDNLTFPNTEIPNLVIGKSHISFNINEDGSIDSVTTVKSCGYEPLDKEAERVISIMPLWTPGSIDGKSVKLKYTIPFGWHLD